MANKLLVISIDALNAKDYPYIQELSVFEKFMNQGSYVRSMDSVYPSLTYCCHTSIITGTYPEEHGIFHNEQYDPDHYMGQDWFWHAKDIKVATLFDYCKKAHLKTASLLWPVLASNTSITYNIPEIWSERGESSTSLFFRHGSLKLLPIVLKNRRLLNEKKQPNLDNFTEKSTCDLISKKHIDFMTVHFTELDDIRHRTGVFSQESKQVLGKINQRLSRIMDVIDLKWGLDHTNIILLGDHGGNDFDKAIYLNTLFLKEGLLDVDEHKNISNWDAYANQAGGSVHVHLKDPSNSNLYQQVNDLIQKISASKDSPIKAFYTREDVHKHHHLFGSFSFVLEAKDGYIFRNDIKDKWIVDVSGNSHVYKSDHGFLPSHPNLKTALLALGPDIKKGLTIDRASLVDITPLISHLLKLKTPESKHQALLSLIKE